MSTLVLPFPHTLSNISFSMKYVRPAFSQFSSTNAKICLLGVQLGTRHQIQVFQGFLEFPHLLRSQALSHLYIRFLVIII